MNLTSTNGFQFEIGLCANINSNFGCGSNLTAICGSCASTFSTCSPIGSFTSIGSLPGYFRNTGKFPSYNDSISFQFRDSAITSCGVTNVTTQIYFICDYSAITPKIVNDLFRTPCQFVIPINTIYGCCTTCSPSPTTSPITFSPTSPRIPISVGSNHGLADARARIVAHSHLNNVFFAGGQKVNSGGLHIDSVDIFDVSNGYWTPTPPSKIPNVTELTFIACATSVGTKTFFGLNKGGLRVFDHDNPFDWKFDTLSVHREKYYATTIGSKAYFFPGYYNDITSYPQYTYTYVPVIDIYDSMFDSWTRESPSSLLICSELALTVGTSVYFYVYYTTSNASINIYQSIDSSWSTKIFMTPRLTMGMTSLNERILYCGGSIGNSYSNLCEILDSNVMTWTTATLSVARTAIAATSVANKAFFAGGLSFVGGGLVSYDEVDIYDYTSHLWTTSKLSSARNYIGATSISSLALFAGGFRSSDGSLFGTVDIFDVSSSSLSSSPTTFSPTLVTSFLPTSPQSPSLFPSSPPTNSGSSGIVTIDLIVSITVLLFLSLNALLL
jgi:hypothetical protein